MASECPRTEGDYASSTFLVPLEDMTNPKVQLEIREVILTSSRDNSFTIRTSTNILLMHSKQLLSAARDVEGSLILDCCNGGPEPAILGTRLEACRPASHTRGQACHVLLCCYSNTLKPCNNTGDFAENRSTQISTSPLSDCFRC